MMNVHRSYAVAPGSSGFVVFRYNINTDRLDEPMAGFSTVAEAVAFIRSRMEPEAMEVKWDKPEDPQQWVPGVPFVTKNGDTFGPVYGDFTRLKCIYNGKVYDLTPSEPRMEPEGEGEKAFLYKDGIVKPWPSTGKPLDELQRPGQEYDAAPAKPKCKVGDLIEFDLHGKTRRGTLIEITEDLKDRYFTLSMEVGDELNQCVIKEREARAAALDEIQAEGQKFDATPTDPPWKRVKLGDWIKVKGGMTRHVVGIYESATEKRIQVAISPGVIVRVENHDIKAILPTPPRHGDFGSRPEEDGA